MRKGVWLAAVGMAAMVAMQAARAATVHIEQAGPWFAFAGTDNSGRGVCGVATDWNDGRFFGVKRYARDGYLVVQASKPTWRIRSARIPVRFRMDRYPLWSASAITAMAGRMVQLTIPLDNIGDFVGQFERSSELVLVMGTNGVEWRMDLTGTSRVARAFYHCVRSMPE
ncbi:MAG TPA: hypothetical protein VMU82_03100 [Acetobacteraceae bacterium]|nr:hypothetical protein [Acetobacteraceae bacterium]